MHGGRREVTPHSFNPYRVFSSAETQQGDHTDVATEPFQSLSGFLIS